MDLIALVVDSSEPFERRGLAWDLNSLPVPAEIMVYTVAEWKSLKDQGGRFVRTLEQETVWVYERGDVC